MREEHLRPRRLELAESRTQSAFERQNLVEINDLELPETGKDAEHAIPEIEQVADTICLARKRGCPVIWSMGAHVIKCGLSRYIISLMEEGIITHIAGNGAVSIHDFELAYLGATSEDVPGALEDGSFGMWEETGRWMNSAVKEGYIRNLGYGACLARYMSKYPDRFPHRGDSVVFSAYRLGIPATFQITVGTDIIHQHPQVDFSALGGASGIDFAIFCRAVSELEGGVFLNFGSAVTGPEVFLKALAICRNQGYTVEEFTTANFDLLPLGDYRKKVGKDHPHYYYRPRKNIVNRPTSMGGRGYHIEGDHRRTVPALYTEVLDGLGGERT